MLKLLGFSRKAALLGAFWLAINPWHVYFSRGNFETLVALFFVLVGLYLFLRGITRKSYSSFYLSLISFALSVWTYHAERVYVPLLVLALAVVKRKEVAHMLGQSKRSILISTAIISLFAIPFFYILFFTPAATRAAHTSLLRDFHLTLHEGNYANIKELIFDNDVFLVSRHFLGKYFNYLEVDYLFGNGLKLTPSQYPGMGLFYIVNLPIFALGVYSLIFHKNKILKNIALILFILGPIPASLTLDEQHSLRALTWLPFWGVAFTAGVERFIEMRLALKKLLAGIYVVLLCINIIYFADMYFRQFPYFYAELWLYGYKQAALVGCAEKEKYEEVMISDTFGSEGPLYTGVPYEYVLFYCNIHPREFLANNREIPGFAHRRPDWANDSKRNVLIIAAPYDLPLDEIEEGRVEYIKYPNGKTAFVVVRPD
jgi:hypothetical protein